jgi:hypothetical protein
MTSPRDFLPVLTGVLLSLVSLFAAYLALSAFGRGEYGNALISAGGALAFGALPLSRMSKADLGKTANELAIDAIKRPEPLPMRIIIGIAWICILAGVATFFF